MEFELDRDGKFGKEGLAFDDVLLVPAESAVLPHEVSTVTRLTRTIALEIPIVSAAMDTVTEARLAIALAREGGIGVLHRNLSIEDQVAEVDKVKRSEAGMIVEPVTLMPDALVGDALALMARYRVSGVPITDASGVLVGILTNRDLRFGADPAHTVASVMTSTDLVTAPLGTTLSEAQAILGRHKIEKLPLVDSEGRLRGLIRSRTSRSGFDIRSPRRTSGDASASSRRSASGPMRSTGRRRSSPSTWTRSSSTRHTGTREGCWTSCAPSRAPATSR